ncbi:MAG: adenylate/guanylate cyclase domain-containing protein, partial [Spirochaetae bacterium HGW-Spirochaetae-6]
FTVYKYNPKWEAFFIRGEEFNEFYEDSNRIFRQNMWDILIITLISIIIGIFLMRYILRFVREITAAILQMTENQQLEIIDVGRAPGDDITFLGVAFNALSNTIGTLLNIFRKFTNKDIVQKAYEERIIKLEGSSRELTCLFSDIKSFTYMTETLGTDIITLLNLHYTKAINEILVRDGIIGSIIGDALLAVYGALDGAQENKSYQALLSAYAIGEVALNIRKRMTAIRDKLIAERGALSERDEKAYKAVLIEVGVGIDGGMVFYGNIGSHERMTNTVIGDNVNSASRLEGLTRIYQVPVICSEYVKDDIINNVSDHRVRFIELDTVQVKGKTIGKKVYWPVMERDVDEQLEKDLTNFSQGLKLYYEGDWKGAFKTFSLCSFSLKDVFIERTEENTCPEDWNGIWAMTTK